MSRVSYVPTGLLVAALAAPAVGAQEQSPRPVLELSIDEAVERALDNNVDIAVERFSPEIAKADLTSAKGNYDPFASFVLDHNKRTDPPRNAFVGGLAVDINSQNWNFGVSQLFKTGGELSMTFSNSRTDTDSIFSTFNPNYNSLLRFDLSQPLLRDFKIDSPRQQLRVSKNNVQISDVQFRQTVINVVANVKRLYYDLIFALDNLEAQRKNLDLAKKLLDENRIKVRVGTLAPLDVVEAEAEVAGREELMILAEAGLEEAEDAIKQVIFPATDPGIWELRVVPTDRATAEPRVIDVAAAIQNALENRTDVRATRLQLDNSEISLQLAKNRTLPSLDLEAGYGTQGIGGNFLVRDQEIGGEIIDEIPGGYGDALSDVFGRDFPTWSIGIRFSYPILNRSAKGARARSQLALEQAQASLRRLELQVAREVRSAARDVKTNFERVSSTRAARVLQQRRLDAEEKRFAAGMSTNFFVTQAQRDLAFAEVNELQAIADYRKSVIEFDRVQEAGLGGLVVTGGGGGVAIVGQGQNQLGGGIANQGPGQ